METYKPTNNFQGENLCSKSELLLTNANTFSKVNKILLVTSDW